MLPFSPLLVTDVQSVNHHQLSPRRLYLLLQRLLRRLYLLLQRLLRRLYLRQHHRQPHR